MRKSIICLFMTVIVIAGIVGCGGRHTKEASIEDSEVPEKITLGLQKLITPELIVRYEKKYEEYLGENIEIVVFDSGSDVNTAFASGSIDIGIMGTSVLATGLSNDLELEVIWMNDVIGSAESLIVREDSGIDGIDGLKGKKIATPFVSTAHFSLQNAMKNAGITSTDVELLDLQPADILAAWERGDIDGAYIWYPVLGELIDDGGVVLTTSEKQAQEGAITADVTVVRSEFAKKYPEVVKNYVKAQIYGVNMLAEQHEKAVKAIAEAADITVEETEEQIQGFLYLTAEEQISKDYLGRKGKPGEMAEVLKDAAVFLKEQGNISNIPEPKIFENAVNGEFIEIALQESDE